MYDPRLRRRLIFAMSLLATACLVIAAETLSPLLPGTAGVVYQRNVERDIEATALFYTESGDVGDYLNSKDGKYAQSSLKRD